MLTVIDQAIPFLQSLLAQHTDVRALAADQITHETISDADALIVRTVTNVNQALLKNSPVRFVGSATAGTDHIDLPYLQQQRIAFANAPGCNRFAVLAYVQQVFTHLPRPAKKVGVIGCGFVGSLVAEWLQQSNITTICYDPPKARRDPAFISANLTDLYDCDVITIHCELTKAEPYPSFHLINEAFLSKLNDHTTLINSARGDVIDEKALLQHADRLCLCLDVWPNEPAIHPQLLEKALIATPHIAGYTLAAKFQASLMVWQAMQRHFNWPNDGNIDNPYPNQHQPLLALTKQFKQTGDFKGLRNGYLKK